MLAQTQPHGAVAACGNAQGLDLPGSVAPFILRGVALLGVDSVQCPMPLRLSAWRRLADDLDRGKLASLTTHAPFGRVLDVARDIVEGKVRGRMVIDVA